MSIWADLKTRSQAFYKLDYILNHPALIKSFFYKGRLYNFIKCSISQMLKLERAWGLPYWLQTEPFCGCTLKCPLCSVGNNTMKRKRGMMKFKTFKKVIDELEGSVIFLYLTMWGEPLLNRDIFKMINYARKKKIFVTLCTNAFFLDDKATDEIINSDLNVIRIALDGASKETYMEYRKGSNFKRVLENIKRISTEKEMRGKKTPFITMQFILMQHNEHEIEKMKRLAKELKVNNLTIKSVWVPNEKMAKKYLPRNLKYSRYDFKEGSKLKLKRDSLCKVPWQRTSILWDGSVVVCCYDLENEYKIGNIMKTGFKDIWNNKKYRLFRRQINKDKNKIPICRLCLQLSSYVS